MRSLLVAALGVVVDAAGGSEAAQTSSSDLLLASPATATLLGLQRGVRVQRKAPVPREDDEQQMAEAESPSAERGIWEGAFADEDSADLSFADVSLLGLQRSVKVVKKKQQQIPTRQAVAAASEQPPARAAASPVAASLLSLQRGMRVQHKVPVSSMEDDEPEKAEVAARGVWQGALAEEEDPTALSFADVSVLGLQRSAKVVKKTKQTLSKRAPVSEQPAPRAAAAGGGQDASHFLGPVDRSAEAQLMEA